MCRLWYSGLWYWLGETWENQSSSIFWSRLEPDKFQLQFFERYCYSDILIEIHLKSVWWLSEMKCAKEPTRLIYQCSCYAFCANDKWNASFKTPSLVAIPFFVRRSLDNPLSYWDTLFGLGIKMLEGMLCKTKSQFPVIISLVCFICNLLADFIKKSEKVNEKLKCYI